MYNRIYNLFFVLTASFALFAITGCSLMTPDPGDSAGSSAGYTDVAHPFTDVPVPSGFNPDRSKSFIYESGSGTIKAEMLVCPIGSLVEVSVAFLTRKEGVTQSVFFYPTVGVPLARTGTVRVILTNRRGSATDVYSTIIGSQT